MKILRLLYLPSLIATFNLTAMVTDEQVKDSISAIIEYADNAFSKSQELVLDGLDIHSQDFAQPFVDWINTLIEQGKTICVPSCTDTLSIAINADEKINLEMGYSDFLGIHFLMINSGALKKLSMAELKLAIAHEVGHYLYGHCEKSQEKFAQILNRLWSSYINPVFSFCSVTASKCPRYGDRICKYSNCIIIKPMESLSKIIAGLLLISFNREHECEADAFAAQLVPDEEALSSLIAKMMKQDILPNYKTRLLYELTNIIGLQEHPHFKIRLKHMQQVMRESKKNQ